MYAGANGMVKLDTNVLIEESRGGPIMRITDNNPSGILSVLVKDVYYYKSFYYCAVPDTVILSMERGRIEV